ncbi:MULTISPECIES: fumarylacetoacetate hydrolase family protein [unclassified Caballeronia]|uniref:fumarylacetoacetate hydrolase family protein n=1 Tax=unclassified Caballeronia TaxID=2646786 RepID=UPI002858A008|nr:MULTISPECIES: fumarylacetoacetate hydrolase family protein [unclassified Caballeronia]MDR5777158.1 fumarylacetoacetate hydrolase family protein [Caballeronia sp. LZ002]MDR5852617.1 fumarylacetoacetate hydrolase family protein [Caballeronia sp. LZ003]
MKVVRYLVGDAVRYGELRGDSIHPLSGDFPDLSTDRNAAPLAVGDVRLLAPVRPGKVVAVGPNYRAHLVGRPLPERPFLWIKPRTAVLDPGETIVIPQSLQGRADVNHESELAIVIGRRMRNVAAREAMDHVFGYTCINDVTAGNLDDRAAFRASADFVDGKIFDTFGPLGPLIETVFDPADVRIRCRINGEVRQDHRTSGMIWPCDELLAKISTVLTLEPGDVIATGSPPGVGAMRAGDLVEVEIDGIGVLRNRVEAEQAVS